MKWGHKVEAEQCFSRKKRQRATSLPNLFQIQEKNLNAGVGAWIERVCHARFNALLRVTISFGARDPKCRLFLTRYVYCNILDCLFDIATAMAATPFQADLQNAANTQKILRARQAVENHEEEGCVYSLLLSDLIGKLLELKYIRSTRAHRYHRLSL